MTFNGRVEAQFTIPASTTISVTTNGGGPTVVTLTAGTYFLSTFLTQLATDLNTQRPVTGGTWSVSLDTSTGKVTIAVTNGTYSISWTSTDVRDLLGFSGNQSSVATATSESHARGLWMPDAPVSMDHSYLSTPRKTDARSMRGPTGFTVMHVGNVMYEHTNVRWDGVPANRVWLASESVTNESFERFHLDYLGLGHAFFTPGPKCTIRIHDSSATQVGNGSITGWYLGGMENLERVARKVEGWEGLWAVQLPSIWTNG